jgi:hypothetical protein
VLKQNADDLGASGFDSRFGWGRVNAYRSVSAAAGTTAPAPPPAPPPPTSTTFTPIRVNAGGGAYTDAQGRAWKADTGYSGGTKWSTTLPVAKTATPALYQTLRYGAFSYQFTVPDGSYTVNLKFAEASQTAAGLRQFNVAINGATVLRNFDIVAATGGKLIAIDKSFPVSVTGGRIAIQFSNGAAKWPLVNAIEIVQGTSSGTTAAAPIRVNTGGGAYTDPGGGAWSIDKYFSGGSRWSTSSWISGTTAQELYRTVRYGSSFAYQIAVPNGNYRVTLRFAEVSQTAAGQRVFHVAINGAPVLANFDILAQAGGRLKALDKSFAVSVSGGSVRIQFSSGPANSPMVNAIEIEPQ